MRVVRCPQRTDLALFFEPFEHIEAFLDGDEVVYLVELDLAVEEAQGVLDLALRLPVVGSPYFGRHRRPVAAMFSQGVAQHPLGLTVHRGGVEEGRASVEGGAHDLLACLLLLAAAHVEDLPGPKAHGRDLYVTAPEPAALHLSHPPLSTVRRTPRRGSLDRLRWRGTIRGGGVPLRFWGRRRPGRSCLRREYVHFRSSHRRVAR